MKFNLHLLLVILALLITTSCTTVKAKAQYQAICNSLTNQIIFSGATNDTRQAEIESSAKPLQMHSFDKYCS